MGRQLLFNLEEPPAARSFYSEEFSGRAGYVFLPAAPRSLSVSQHAAADARSLKNKLRLGSGLVARTVTAVLAHRGLASHPDLDGFLSPSLTNLPDHALLRGFDRAVGVILDAIRSKHTIGIVGDYDVDGVTSVAQFVKTLRSADVPHRYWIPNRFKDGYGISDRIVQELIDSGCKVAVLFDNGTHAHKQIARLREHGIEVVVFDHHEVGETLPDCILVSPRQPGCGLHREYPSAAGLSALLNNRLRELLGLPLADLSLAAAGTIADMVPLHGINRVIARIGLSDMRRNCNLGISALARRFWLDYHDIVSGDIGFRIGPAINAAGRLGDGSAGFDGGLCVELLTTADSERAKTIADTLYRVNEERKQRQRELLLSNYLRLAKLHSVPPVIVSYADSHHAGLNGLVAQGLASRYARPAFVLSSNEDGSFTGSARNGHESFDLMKILQIAKDNDASGAIVRAGGHTAAAGVTVSAQGLATFEGLVTQAFHQLYPAPSCEVHLVADATLTFRDLTPEFVSRVEALLEPHGQGFAPPQYLFDDVIVEDVQESDGGRYMLTLSQPCTKRTVRAFVGPEIWNNDIQQGSVVRLIAAPAQIYGKKRCVQLSVSGYAVTAAPPAPKNESVKQPEELMMPAIEEDHNFASVDSDQTLEVPLAVFDTFFADEFEVAVGRVKPKRDPNQPTRFEQLKGRLHQAVRAFDARYIYPELEGLEPDYFRPRTDEETQSLWEKLINRCGLAITTKGLEYRPWCEEFIRYFFDNPRNHVLQAPTGSGKTEIALSIASHYRKQNRRVLMVAPTIDIVRDLAGRVKRLLEEDAVVLDGGLTSPDQRMALYATHPGFIVATPHVIANDLKDGSLAFSKDDLFIVDEAHQARGNASVIRAIAAARAVGSRILGLTATPAQVLPGRSWMKLAELFSAFGVTEVFPLNVRARRPEIRVHHLPLTREMREAEDLLACCNVTLQQQSLRYFKENDLQHLTQLALRLFGKGKTLFPTPYGLRPLLQAMRELPDFSDWGVYNSLKAIGELSELRQALVRQGITAFLLRCIEKRFEVNYPTKAPKGRTQLSSPTHLKTVYSSREVQSAFNLLARGEAIELWSHHEHARCIGISNRSEWEQLSPGERRRAFSRTVSTVKRRVIESLASLSFVNHPKEHYLLARLGRDFTPSFVSTRLIDHAMFLTKRIDHQVSSRTGRVITLTGLGSGVRKGVSRSERKSNLAAFNSGSASVIVGTSAAGLGIDIVADYGCTLDFDSSQTTARQKEGRVGRRSFGVFEYLCSTPEDHAKVNNIMHKDIAFQEMLNAQRAKVVEQSLARIFHETA